MNRLLVVGQIQIILTLEREKLGIVRGFLQGPREQLIGLFVVTEGVLHLSVKAKPSRIVNRSLRDSANRLLGVPEGAGTKLCLCERHGQVIVPRIGPSCLSETYRGLVVLGTLE